MVDFKKLAKQQKQQKQKKQASKTPAPKNQLVTNDDSAMIITGDQMPDYINRNDQRGTEKLGMADLIIPRLEICQGLSPAVKKGDPGYIKGAQAGMLNNSVTRALYGDSVNVVPVHYAMQYLVWRDRKAAEAWNKENPRSKKPIDGFFGAFTTNEEAIAEAESEGGAEECIEVVDTPTHLCLIIDHVSASVEEIMIPMPRTKAKISRQWNTLVKLGGGPRFGRVYKISTVLQKNEQGDFYNYSIASIGFASKNLFGQADRLYTNVEKGGREIKMDTKDYSSSGVPASDDANARM